jgi:hypothetical protein
MATQQQQRTTAPEATATSSLPAVRSDAPAQMQVLTFGGVQVRTIDDMKWFCTELAKSGLLPEHFRGKPADVMVAVQWGFEIGVSPMNALQNICVIKGRASIWGDLVLGLLQSRKDIIEYVLEDDLEDILRTGKARCEIKRVGYPRATVVTYTKEMATKAGLMQKDTYRQHEARMLQCRARAFCARNAAADVLKGLAITDTLLDDTGLNDVTPDDERPAPRTVQQPQPRRAAAPEPQDAEVIDDGHSATFCGGCGVVDGEEHLSDCPEAPPPADDRQTTLPGMEAGQAGGAAQQDQQQEAEYVPPQMPLAATDALTRACKLRGKTIYTAGISNVTLMKVEWLVDRLDKSSYRGAWRDAMAGCFTQNTPPDWYHLTEEQGRQFADYLQQALA